MGEDRIAQALGHEMSRRLRVERAIPFVRLAVGLIFFLQGVLKFIDPNMGVNRFTRIGFPHPAFTAHFVGTFEMVCGFLVLIGLLTRLAATPLLVVICTAIGTTKIPELWRPNQGFWFMVSDARADFAMLMSLLFLLIAGAGAWALDRRISFYSAISRRD
jgi:putative oxidoreductase